MAAIPKEVVVDAVNYKDVADFMDMTEAYDEEFEVGLKASQ